MQGKNEWVHTCILHFERALNVIKQLLYYAMTKKDGVKLLKDYLFHGLKPNIHNALHYMYDRPESQYSQLVMAVRKAETETPSSNVSEARAKYAVVGTNSQPKVASSDPPYEAVTQQIAHMMSAITNQNSSKNNECNGSKSSNGNGKFSSAKFQRQKRDRKDMACWGCGGSRYSWRKCSTHRQGNNLPFKPTNQNQNQNTGQNLNG